MAELGPLPQRLPRPSAVGARLAERGCVPLGAGSAAARPRGEAAQIHPPRPTMRSRCDWSRRHSRAPSERRRSAAVSRAERDQPQRVRTERRLEFSPTRPTVRSRCGWSRRHSRAPFTLSRSAAVSRSARDQPPHVRAERRPKFIPHVRRCAAVAAGRGDTAALRASGGRARRRALRAGVRRAGLPPFIMKLIQHDRTGLMPARIRRTRHVSFFQLPSGHDGAR